MSAQKKHVIVLPYYCQEEVDRYLTIAKRISEFPTPQVAHTYLLAASPRTECSQQLADAYSKLGEVQSFQCPSQIFGYPQGPTAMFWDAMEYAGQHFADSNGFALWLESDMCPIKSDWLDRLSDEWYQSQQTPIMMGCYVPEVYKYRVFRKPKLLLDPHINGGACYSMKFASQMPSEAREGVFDMAVYKYATSLGAVKKSLQIAFSTMDRVRNDLLDEQKVLLHGFMQDKDAFIEQCVTPPTATESQNANWLPLKRQVEMLRRRMRVLFVRRGHRAMLENMLLAKDRMESRSKAA